MIRYTVVWVQSVEDELIEIWLDAKDRYTITTAPTRAIANLARTPTRRARILPRVCVHSMLHRYASSSRCELKIAWLRLYG